MMNFPLTWLNREDDLVFVLMFSNVTEKAEAMENAQVTSWHPSATLLSPPLFFHSSHTYLNVWFKAVKSWPGKRDEKGMKEDRKKV